MHDPLLVVFGSVVGLLGTIVNGMLFRHLRRMDAMEAEREKDIKASLHDNSKALQRHSNDIFAIQLWIRNTARQYGFTDLFDKD